MGIKTTLSNTTNYVQKFANTAYDQIKTVYDNLASIIIVSDNIADVNNIAAVGDIAALGADVDALLLQAYTGLKSPCIVASTANLTLSGTQTIDGIALVAGDRVLVKDQTTASENGIYAVNTSTWAREPDWDGVIPVVDVVEGTLVPVSRGTANADTIWKVTNTGAITIGTTSVTLALGTSLSNGNAITVTAATDSTSGSTGSIHTAGGIGAVKDIVTDSTFKPLGQTSASDKAAVGYTTSDGLHFLGTGSLYDVACFNTNGSYIWGVPTGTTEILFYGTIDSNGTNDSTSGVTGAIHTDGGIGAKKDIVTDAGLIVGTNFTYGGVVQPVVGAQVANHIRAGNIQIHGGGASAGAALAIDTDLTFNTWESVGPTGSGATNIWTPMDVIPSNATILICLLNMGMSAVSAADASIVVYAAQGDIVSPTASDTNTVIARNANDPGASSGQLEYQLLVYIPLGPTNQDFKLRYSGASTGSMDIDLFYRGFMTD